MEEYQKYNIFPGQSIPEKVDSNSDNQGTWNNAKLALRCSNFVVCIIMIGISADKQTDTSTLNVPNWYFCLPIALISILWDAAELIVVRVRKRNPGILPGWHVAIDFAIFGGTVTALSFVAMDLSYVFGPWASETHPTTKATQSRTSALLGFIALFCIVRFVLFVLACIETHRRNRAAQVERVLKALRQTDGNIKETPLAYRANDPLYQQVHGYTNDAYHGQHIPTQELSATIRYPQELSSEPAFHAEMPGDRVFPVELSVLR
ncbi:hypothetical protein F4779DRAFT_610182 [Xylariaceae sp. FL0662B]|nr:hypothetical protein F4779DRAFT_610182 [Xylariaceae sp. FL0662B]